MLCVGYASGVPGCGLPGGGEGTGKKELETLRHTTEKAGRARERKSLKHKGTQRDTKGHEGRRRKKRDGSKAAKERA